ncbi:CDGSH iron-sulfur domain-containing protein [Streptomyces sp. NPDC017940]|uniref:CDGSH iron-sulfur domain-containing protein n=1 Tax=Streptomyces sp. NPDC017940 TaxID=3365017 RepID=UPI0037A5A4DE
MPSSAESVPGSAERPRERPRRVTVDREGPLLVEGPVEVVCDDGSVAVSDRFTVAICTCRRSRTYPWCDTSHRRRTRQNTADASGSGTGPGPGEGADTGPGHEGPVDTKNTKNTEDADHAGDTSTDRQTKEEPPS